MVENWISSSTGRTRLCWEWHQKKKSRVWCLSFSTLVMMMMMMMMMARIKFEVTQLNYVHRSCS